MGNSLDQLQSTVADFRVKKLDLTGLLNTSAGSRLCCHLLGVCGGGPLLLLVVGGGGLSSPFMDAGGP